MPIPLASYLQQSHGWPQSGEHILAHYDEASIIVYQAYRPSIARFAIENGRFGGAEFSFSRMSWIKPNFLWMMFRSGWGTKEGQEVVLGLRIARSFFDEILSRSVASSFSASGFSDETTWRSALTGSEVRRQWDPDHDPSGAPVARRAIQLGLRGEMLARFATRELMEVIDMTKVVEAQRPNAGGDYASLTTPTERVYQPSSRPGQ